LRHHHVILEKYCTCITKLIATSHEMMTAEHGLPPAVFSRLISVRGVVKVNFSVKYILVLGYINMLPQDQALSGGTSASSSKKLRLTYIQQSGRDHGQE
jgi:hypothetical protein